MMEQIARCDSLPQLWRLMIAFFHDYGFGGLCYFSYGLGESGIELQTDKPFHHGFSPAVVEAYLASDVEHVDVVLRLSMAHGRPLRWRETWASVEPNEEERAYLTLMRAVDLGDGFTLPCYGPHGRNGFFAIGAMTPEARADEISTREMHITAQAAHMAMCRLTGGGEPLLPGKPLSAREREILDWVARGKSNSVIAEILSISAGTVDTYLRRIYEKLGVSDRTSAAVRGIGMGLIAA